MTELAKYPNSRALLELTDDPELADIVQALGAAEKRLSGWVVNIIQRAAEDAKRIEFLEAHGHLLNPLMFKPGDKNLRAAIDNAAKGYL